MCDFVEISLLAFDTYAITPTDLLKRDTDVRSANCFKVHEDKQSEQLTKDPLPPCNCPSAPQEP